MNNVIIISQARSGSTYISMLLKPNFENNIIDPFDPLNPATSYDVAQKTLEKIMSCDNLLIRDNILIHYLANAQDTGKIHELVNQYKEYINSNFYRIKLIRDDVFNMSLSNALTIINKKYYHMWDKDFAQELLKTQIEIDEEFFYNLVVEKLSKNNVLTEYGDYDQVVYYKDLVSDPQADLASLNLGFTKINYDRILYKLPDSKNRILNYNKLCEVYKIACRDWKDKQ